MSSNMMCNDCWLSMQNCHDRSICCEMDEYDGDQCDLFEPMHIAHGHWIEWSGEKMVDYYNETYKKIHGYRCSNCNRNTAVKSKYCSCCGAKMDEKIDL